MSGREGEIIEKLDRMKTQIDRIENKLFFGEPGAPSVVEEIASLRSASKRDSTLFMKQIGAIVLAIVTTAGAMWGVGKAANDSRPSAVESAGE